jgi:hypothetical protein
MTKRITINKELANEFESYLQNLAQVTGEKITTSKGLKVLLEQNKINPTIIKKRPRYNNGFYIQI